MARTSTTKSKAIPFNQDEPVRKPRVIKSKLFSEDLILPPISSDLRDAARLTPDSEIRYLVDAYYAMQKIRIASGNADFALSGSKEPHQILGFISEQQERIEKQIQVILDEWSGNNINGIWMRNIVGIGPVISSGLLAHLNIEKAATAGAFWRFAGLDPTLKWEKGQIRPWNAKVKLLCWKLGESFVKVSGNENAFYGHLYKARKELETFRNERGDHVQLAFHELTTRTFRAAPKMKKTTPEEQAKEIQATVSWYQRGMLPPGRIHLRATRYAATIFLSHLHEVMFFNKYGIAARRPYVYEYKNHAHVMEPPHLEGTNTIKAIRARQPTVSIAKFVEAMPNLTPPQDTPPPSWFNAKSLAPKEILDRLALMKKQNQVFNNNEPFDFEEGME